MTSNFTEYYHQKTGLTIGVTDVLFSKASAYQQIEILETDSWGRLLTLDGLVMLSEKDEFVYHEMLSHVPLFTHPNPERVLIIGGGDGGTAREVMRHPSVQKVDLVEIDEEVVHACQKYLPSVGDWRNPKLTVHFEDGIAFMQEVNQSYDVILIDGSDPVGPAAGLFSKNFLKKCCAALTENGILATQSEGPWIKKYHSEMKSLYVAMEQLFKVAKLYTAAIPLYPAGLWSFALATKGANPLDKKVRSRLKARLLKLDKTPRYYNENIHGGCFALPTFLRDLIL